MLKRLAALALFAVPVSLFACANERDAEDPSMMQGQYGQQRGPGMQQPGMQQPGMQTQPQAAPNPLAPPCSMDSQCLTAKCNISAGKCQVPCASANDCQAGYVCTVGACVPPIPGAPAQ